MTLENAEDIESQDHSNHVFSHSSDQSKDKIDMKTSSEEPKTKATTGSGGDIQLNADDDITDSVEQEDANNEKAESLDNDSHREDRKI